MPTLYKRATPSQAMILRIVEGAVKNVCDSHHRNFDPRFARSVAKRAAGTLTAEMPNVLAAKPSEKLGMATIIQVADRAARGEHSVDRSIALSPRRAKAGRSQLLLVAPLDLLEKWMFQQMWALKDAGRTEYAEAFIAVLRKISTLKATP